MSNDGINFSNKLHMLSYDSKCSNCEIKDYKDITCVARVSYGHTRYHVIDNQYLMLDLVSVMSRLPIVRLSGAHL